MLAKQSECFHHKASPSPSFLTGVAKDKATNTKVSYMASASGLTRRRGGGATGDDESDPSRVNSPTPKAGFDNRNPETSYTGGENGHKIAFDPRDISETEERNKQPKLTLMEEVLLLGLKDKQVLDLTNYGNNTAIC